LGAAYRRGVTSFGVSFVRSSFSAKMMMRSLGGLPEEKRRAGERLAREATARHHTLTHTHTHTTDKTRLVCHTQPVFLVFTSAIEKKGRKKGKIYSYRERRSIKFYIMMLSKVSSQASQQMVGPLLGIDQTESVKANAMILHNDCWRIVYDVPMTVDWLIFGLAFCRFLFFVYKRVNVLLFLMACSHDVSVCIFYFLFHPFFIINIFHCREHENRLPNRPFVRLVRSRCRPQRHRPNQNVSSTLRFIVGIRNRIKNRTCPRTRWI